MGTNMTVRELEANTRALTKAISAKEPTSVILSIIDVLKKNGSPTEDMLRTTKAGVLVGRLRASENREISSAASELVYRWKRAVEAEKKRRAQQRDGGSAKGSTAAGTASAAGTATTTTTTLARRFNETYKGDPEKRKYKTDGINVNRTGSATRNACIGLMYDGLAYRSEENALDVLEKAQTCEAAALEHFGGETTEYKTKMRSLFQNLKAKTNRELGVRVMAGSITPQQFVTLSSEELKSAELRKVESKLMEENIKNAQVAAETRSISAELKCGGCGMRKVAYTQAQTRSADEPMTTFCECMNCGKRWKFS